MPSLTVGLLILYRAVAFRKPQARSFDMTRFRYLSTAAILLVVVVVAGYLFQASAQKPRGARSTGKALADNDALNDVAPSEMRPILEYYVVDRGSLQRSYPVANSPARRERFRKFYSDALEQIQKLNFDGMSQEGKVDYILFRTHLEHELRQLDIEEKQLAEIAPLIPFGKTIVDMEETRRRMEPIESAKAAVVLTALKKQIDDTRRMVEAGLRGSDPDAIKIKKTVAFRGVNAVNSLRGNLRNWYTFYNGYDPVFTWWNEEPYKTVDEALNSYASFLSERVVGLRSAPGTGQTGQQGGPRGGAGGTGAPPGGGGGGTQGFQRPGSGVAARPGDTSDIIGDPIGHDALMSELQSEMIPYTPEELIAIANKEFAWCENEMKKASRGSGLRRRLEEGRSSMSRTLTSNQASNRR